MPGNTREKAESSRGEPRGLTQHSQVARASLLDGSALPRGTQPGGQCVGRWGQEQVTTASVTKILVKLNISRPMFSNFSQRNFMMKIMMKM